MKDVMIDFETLGKGPHKAICQVGAVYFDRTTGDTGPAFKANIDARSHEKHGGVLDADTVYWWLQQSEQARHALMDDQRDIYAVFAELNDFLANADRIWSHATFDFVTLCDTFKLLNIVPRFSYKAGLDLRTLTYLAKVSPQDFVREGIHHEGLHDAIFQVKYAVAALNKIQGNRAIIVKLGKLFD